MKINKLFNLALVLFGSFYLTSCHEMDLFPQDQLGPDNFWKSERDIEMGLTGVYSKMKNGYMDWNMYWLEGLTDNAYCKHSSQSVFFNMQQGYIEPTTGGPVSGVYAGSYTAISACNVFLKNFYQVKESIFTSDSDANKYEAEVRFLRAYCYFNLVMHYGDVPLYKELLDTIEDYKVKQSPAEDVYAFINEDLDFAIENLEDVAYTSGHAVKASAKALKARFALFRGDWKTVESETKGIIDAGKNKLADTYESIFIKREGQANNPEIIFSINYMNPDYRHNAEMEFYYWSALTPTQDLIDIYDLEKDKRAKSWYVYAGEGGKKWTNPFGNEVEIEQTTLTGYILLKHFDKNDKNIYSNSAYDFRTDNNVIVLRYADVLLMYVEAMLEQNNGVTTDPLAVQVFNSIRERAGLETVSSVTREELRKERRRELAFEGLRHFDLIRWKIAKDVMNNLVTPGGPCYFEDRYYVWPFPQSEMDINPNLDQKSGY